MPIARGCSHFMTNHLRLGFRIFPPHHAELSATDFARSRIDKNTAAGQSIVRTRPSSDNLHRDYPAQVPVIISNRLIVTAVVMVMSCRSFLAAAPASPLSPADELASFHLADDQLKIELVASEPNVISPVAIAWDADGRMFVAEMMDYPLGPGTGQIRMLEDLDGDGFYEKATVFADKLPFPNGVLPWNGGLLATAAPNIWFLKDTDGDGRADERRVVLAGFGEGNQQLRVNGLSWGLDNWVYGANGRSDGVIRDPGDATGKKASLRNHDFRFQPSTGKFEAIAGRSQFGRARDDWGNYFLSWNTIPIRQVVIEERYLARNPQLSGSESVLDIIDPSDTGRVYPLTPPPLVFNNESSIHYNALAGLTIFRGDALGEKYRGNAFMGEALRNLVHRRVLEPNGVTFLARRGEENKEFLASTDPWFHSVNFATGPDGALYIADFYRQFVEHPEFVHNANVEKKIPWRTGAEHGRIWRIVRRDARPTLKKPRLSHASSAELVRHFGDANGWWRDTAQRLLVERQDRAAIPLLRSKIKNPNPESLMERLHALWTLDGLRALDEKLVTTALRDKSPIVRASAIKLSDDLFTLHPSVPQPGKTNSFKAREPRGLNYDISRAPTRRIETELLRLISDPDPQVRLQLALSIHGASRKVSDEALTKLAAHSIGDQWQSLAILCGLQMSPWDFFQSIGNQGSILVEGKPWLTLPNDDVAFFVEKCATMIGADPKESNFDDALNWALAPRSNQTLGARLVWLAGLAEGLEQCGQSLHERLVRLNVISKTQTPWRASIVTNLPDVVRSESVRPRIRVAALRVLAETEPAFASATLVDVLRPENPAPVRTAAIQAMVRLDKKELPLNPFARWNEYSQTTRRQLASATSRSAVLAGALLDSLEQNKIPLIEIDASTRQSLLKASNSAVRIRAQKLFQSAVNPDRENVVANFRSALQLNGDMEKGAAVFAKDCFVCHRIQGRGNSVGPDLSGIASRPPEAILTDILDPSRQVTPDFLSYTVTKTNEESLTGLISAETPASITLRRPSVPDETIMRSQLKELRADNKSLMPDGLEQGLSVQDIADLLMFLGKPDGSLLPRE